MKSISKLQLAIKIVCGLAAAASLNCAQATDQFFINSGTLTNVPQVDAVNFVNEGNFTVSTTLPYETYNTLNFTNTGVMSGDPGFFLDTLSFDGSRKVAASFYNSSGASIEATSFAGPLGSLGGGMFGGAALENPQVYAAATNVISNGMITVPSSGRVHLEATSMDLTRSGVGVEPPTGGRGFQTSTNFFPDIGLSDLYWGLLSDGSVTLIPGSLVQKVTPKISTNIVNGTNVLATNFVAQAAAPPHPVTNVVAFGGFALYQPFTALLTLSNATGFVLTNKVADTNWVIQAVLVQTSGPDFTADVKFAPTFVPPFKTPIVNLTANLSNVLDGTTYPASLYIQDTLAWNTNLVGLTNVVTTNTLPLPTFRPSNYEVTRTPPPGYLMGRTNNALPTLLTDKRLYTNGTVPYLFSAYEFGVTNIPTPIPNVPGASITNTLGRVEIQADNLNLERARVRGEGLITVTTTNLLSNTKSALDCPNLSLNLQSGSPEFAVQGVIPDTADRLHGFVKLWSGVWTNDSSINVTNVDQSGNTNVTPVSVTFHFLMVDASGLDAKEPVLVHNLVLQGGNVVLGDNATVENYLLVNAPSLTIATNRELVVGPNEIDLSAAEFPSVAALTNYGVIAVTRTINLGQDRPFPYQAVVNYGTNICYNFEADTSFFQNSGRIGLGSDAGGRLSVQADSIVLDGGVINAGGEIDLSAADILMRNSTNTAGQALALAPANSLADGGPGTTNVLTSSGFTMQVKPASGDMLYSAFISVAQKFELVRHIWAATDEGANASGFHNNQSIGHLVIQSAFDSLHEFSPATGNNALYVDYLEFKGPITNDVTSGLQIDPGMTLYFADSNLSPGTLNGMFNGRLVWTPSFAGPSSSVTVTLQSGRTLVMNRALYEMMMKNGGIPDGFNPASLDGSSVKISQVRITRSAQAISFSWPASPQSVYEVQASSALSSPNWQALTTYTNATAAVQPATVTDRILSAGAQRFYRILKR